MSGWTDAEIEIVKAAAARGDSARKIAMGLPGRSRGAVIGICNRKGIALGALTFRARREIDGREMAAEIIAAMQGRPTSIATQAIAAEITRWIVRRIARGGFTAARKAA